MYIQRGPEAEKEYRTEKSSAKSIEECIGFCKEKQKSLRMKADLETFGNIQIYLETLLKLKTSIKEFVTEMNIKGNTDERNTRGRAVWEDDV